MPQQNNAKNSSQPEKELYMGESTWFELAACKGIGYLMFPKEHKDITYIAEARKTCASCPVKPECL
jgi:hypothetical protein